MRCSKCGMDKTELIELRRKMVIEYETLVDILKKIRMNYELKTQ